MATSVSSQSATRIATRSDDEAIHRLNYRTFVEEIPQHEPNAEHRLVDRFHDDNLYVVHEVDGCIVGMVAARTARPFSLDQKLGNVDAYLPVHTRAAELRLLAVDRQHRSSRVFTSLVAFLTDHLARNGYDIAVISGTTRQLRLYEHLGYTPFGPLVGREGARYQPMYITLDRLGTWSSALRTRATANFLPGPVAISRKVQAAFAECPVSHRSREFLDLYRRTTHRLCEMTGTRFATVLPGSGTLANDVVAAQLRERRGMGLILSNGEFGERLLDHASRMSLQYDSVQVPWGDELSLDAVRAGLATGRYDWLWMVHCETSTGVLNPLEQITEIAAHHDVRVAVDAISSIGAVQVDLSHVAFATAVSGKALQSFPGLAIVLHNEQVEPSKRIPRYLDLGLAHSKSGVPFTQSSNLLAALHGSLAERCWSERFNSIRADAAVLREALERRHFKLVADARSASPAVHTIALPERVCARTVCTRLRALGWLVSFESDYLAARNWLQVCLMGEYTQEAISQFPIELRAACDDLSEGTEAE